MIEVNKIYYHKTLNHLVKIKRYTEGQNIATFYYLNNDLTIMFSKFYFSTSERIGIGNIKNLVPYDNINQLELF